MNTKNQYIDMDKFQENLSNLETKEFTGDYSWMKQTGKRYHELLKNEIEKLEI